MSDKGVITAGLVVLVAVVTLPFWYAFAPTGDAAPPDLVLPTDGSQCVEDRAYMRANHMDLLNQWRNSVVREGGREYTSESGQRFEMSLTKTCLSCHDDRDAFCTKCHDYVNVEPLCWECHVVEKGN